MSVTFKRLSGILGAEIDGLDLSRPPLPDEARAVQGAIAENHVLVFHGHALEPGQQVGFVRPFGELETFAPHPSQLAECPEIFRVSNVPGNGYPDVGRYWHTDNSALPKPAALSWLFSVQVPPEGGETLFMNMFDAYERLPGALAAKLEGRTARHRVSGERYIGIGPQGSPGSEHPLIRAHPVTGRKALYVNCGLIRGISGMSDGETREVMDEVRAYLEGMDYYRHTWSAGDFVVWDNASTAHRVLPTDPKYPRTMNRVTVVGTVPHA